MIITAASLLALAFQPVPDTVRLLAKCPADMPACVEMDLDDRSRGDGAARPESDADGVAAFYAPARARLDSGSVLDFVIQFMSFTEGIDCSSVGQATVAVVGYSSSGEPQVLTPTGVLTIIDSPLEVGCVDCARLLSSLGERMGSALRTPAWDVTLVGLRFDGLSYDDDGQLYARARLGCVLMPRTGRFSSVDSERCRATQSIGGDQTPTLGRTLKEGEWIIWTAGRTRFLVLKRGACT